MSSESEQKIKFGVVGGSIGGLSSAYWLRTAGHDVTILEQYSEDFFKNQPFSGLRVPPNASRLLNNIPGTYQVLEEKGYGISGVLFSQEETGELVGKLIYGEEITSDLGSKFYRIPYADLWDHLYQSCIAQKVQFVFNFKVEEVILHESDPPKVVSALKEEKAFDMIIAADGHNSIFRDHVLAEVTKDDYDSDFEDNEPPHIRKLTEWTTSRVSIPLRTMEEDPKLLSLAKDDAWRLCMGDGFLHTCGREGDQYAIATLYYPCPSFARQDMKWDAERTTIGADELSRIRCEPVLKKLLSLGAPCHRTVQKVHRLHSFTTKNCRVVLVGDAGVGGMINGPQNTAIAVEDAYVLGFLFTKIRRMDQIPRYLNGFNLIKSNRAKMIRRSDSCHITEYTFPPGPAREDRNAAFNFTLKDGKTDDEWAEIWQNAINDNNYDAQNVVAEWWHIWGRFIQT